MKCGMVRKVCCLKDSFSIGPCLPGLGKIAGLLDAFVAWLPVERILPGYQYCYRSGKKEVLFKTVMQAVVNHNG